MSDATRAEVRGTNRRVGDALVDGGSGIPIWMTLEHHEIHEGNGWELFQEALLVAASASMKTEIRTGADEVHLKQIRVWLDGAIARFEILQDPTIGTPGTLASNVVNRNRAQPLALPGDLTFWSNAGAITGGSVLESGLIGGGAGVGQTANALAGQDELEYVLKPNSKYIVRISNLDASARNFSMNLFFYLKRED
jgi:hypothetical protein